MYISKLIEIIFQIDRKYKKILIILNDIFLVCISFILASILTNYINEFNYFITLFISVSVSLTLLIFYKSYQEIFRYISISYFYNIFYTSVIHFIILFFFTIIITNKVDVYKLIFLHSFLIFNFITLSRLLINFLRNIQTNIEIKQNILIYGAGNFAVSVIELLKKNYKIVGLIDDDEKKRNLKINGIIIYSKNDIDFLKKKYHVDLVIFAIQNIDINKKNLIFDYILQNQLKIKILPSYNEIINSNSLKLKQFKLEDIFHRDIKININEINNYLKNKIIFITGSAGSIGSELTNQIFNSDFKKLILLDQNEYFLFEQKRKIRDLNNIKCNDVKFILGSINDNKILSKIFSENNVDIVIHAAAYKHVDLIENNIQAGIKTNIIGTYNLLEICKKFEVNNFVFISSDKAVRPSSIMGMTKRFSEILIQNYYNDNKLNLVFSIVRFGNVIGSTGSVIPIFIDQIQNNKPLTITDPNATRFFMTVNEACKLVLESIVLRNKNNIYLFKMGEPIKIIDLAHKIASFFGSKISNNEGEWGVKINYTGLKKGEKINEELLVDNDSESTENENIYISKEKFIKIDVRQSIIELHKLLDDNNKNNLIKFLKMKIVN